MSLQDGAECRGAVRTDRRASRILGPRRHDHRLRASGKRGCHRFELWPVTVNGDWFDDEAAGHQQVVQRRIAGVLENHAIPGPQVLTQHALDRIERSSAPNSDFAKVTSPRRSAGAP